MAITGAGSVYLQATPGISPYSQRTIAAWIKLPPSGTTMNLFMALVGSSFSYQMNLHFAGNPTPNIFGSVCQSQNGTTIDGTASSQSANILWHFVLATFDNGGVTGNVQTIRIYVDGVLNGTVTAGGPVTALVDNDPGSSLYVWPGSTDGNAQVAYPMVWKRLVSQAEITALAANGDPRTVAPSQLVSFAQLNQGSGTITDLATPAIHWVVTGGTLSVVADPFSLTMANTPTTLERASFCGQKGSTINLKFNSMTSYAVGTAFNVGPITGVITNVLNYNTVKARVTGGPSSQPLLLPRGTNVT
jgi:Concanavalin A-like lectin/glucanases superfamily